MKVQAPADASSAPRKQFLVDFNKAFAESNVDYIISHVSEDVVWEMVGDKKVQGKEEMRAELESMAEWVPDALTIHSVITHGREGAANGELSFPEDEKVAFCDVYKFADDVGNTIQYMRSYGLNL
jgi:limonene-1,2-epoxide hydrolase